MVNFNIKFLIFDNNVPNIIYNTIIPKGNYENPFKIYKTQVWHKNICLINLHEIKFDFCFKYSHSYFKVFYFFEYKS